MWKYSKKDFFVSMVTMTFVFVFDTSIGLAIGLGTSVLVYCIFDIVLAKSHEPRLFSASRDGNNVDIVRIESDLNFLTAARIKDFITTLVLKIPEQPEVTNASEYYRFQLSYFLNSALKPKLLAGVTKLPNAIVLDLCMIKTVDFSGLEALHEAIKEVRKNNVLVALVNINPSIELDLVNCGIYSDKSTEDIDFEDYESTYRMDLWNLQHQPLKRASGAAEQLDYVVYSQVGSQPATGQIFEEHSLQTVVDVSEHQAIETRRRLTSKDLDVEMTSARTRHICNNGELNETEIIQQRENVQL